MDRLFWICLAGALGTGARYLIGLWAARSFGNAFPYGTLLVNLTGCFLVSVIVHVGLYGAIPPMLRTALTIGFLGGLTTYSSFNYETLALSRNDGVLGVVYALATVGGGLLAGWLGLAAGRRLLGS